MRNKILSIMAVVMAVAMLLTACDDHIQEDLSWHSWQVGMVYGANGDITTYERCVASGNTPEAVVFYIDTEDAISGKAYAVSLYDNRSLAFSATDTTYAAQGTSADITAFDGESNTTALRYYQIASPIADAVDAKYFIPSVAEMYKLFVARDVVNITIAQCGGDLLPTSDTNCWYWTSTECEDAETDRAWRFSLYSGRFESTDKHTSLPVRPIMMIRLNQEEQQEEQQ